MAVWFADSCLEQLALANDALEQGFLSSLWFDCYYDRGPLLFIRTHDISLRNLLADRCYLFAGAVSPPRKSNANWNDPVGNYDALPCSRRFNCGKRSSRDAEELFSATGIPR